MIRLQINPAYAELLAENHLSTYRELMETDAGQVIEENDERDVRRLQLNQTGFYLKRVWREKASAALESYLAGRLAHGRTYREKQQYECLQRHGFDVAEIAAVGEELHYAFPANGFILTREVPGKNLLDLFREADEDLRLIIARRFGALVGRLYRHGFFGSVRLKDIICADPPGVDARLTLIDREVRHPFPRRPGRKLGMSKLLLNFRRQVQQGEVFSPRELKAFVKHYRRGLSRPMRIKRKLIRQELGAILEKAGRGQPG